MYSGRKKAEERFWLLQLQEKLGIDMIIPEGEEREEPDFIVEIDGEKVGIEVTYLYIKHAKNGSPKRAHESMVNEVVSRAKSIYEVTGAPPVNLDLIFKSSVDLRNIDRKQTAKILSDYVRKMNLSPGQCKDIRSSYYEDTGLPDWVYVLHVLGVPEELRTIWRVPGAGFSAPITVEALQERIDSKRYKLQKYSETVERNWLLIVSDGTKPSQMFHQTAEFDVDVIKSPFERTFYLSYPNRIFLEVGLPV